MNVHDITRLIVLLAFLFLIEKFWKESVLIFLKYTDSFFVNRIYFIFFKVWFRIFLTCLRYWVGVSWKAFRNLIGGLRWKTGTDSTLILHNLVKTGNVGKIPIMPSEEWRMSDPECRVTVRGVQPLYFIYEGSNVVDFKQFVLK